MKTFKVPFSRQDYGYITIKAESAEEAKDLVMQGEFKDEDMYLKGGDTIVDGDILELSTKSIDDFGKE